MKTRLRNALSAYKRTIRSTSFSSEPTIGRELEGCFIDTSTQRLCHRAPEILAKLHPGTAAYELGNMQFELNFAPAHFKGAALDDWHRSTVEKLQRLTAAGANLRRGTVEFSAVPLLTGIAPSTTAHDLTAADLSPTPRMARLEEEWQAAKLRYEATNHRTLCFNTDGHGFEARSVNVSGAMASDQLHLGLPACPTEAAKIYNLILIVTPLVLAQFCGTPIFLNGPGEPTLTGFCESRFQIWSRLDDAGRGRVFYGPGYVSDLTEVLEYYVEQIPFLHLAEDLDTLDDFGLLRRHVKNMWPWLRLTPENDHWRVEVRAFPANSPSDSRAMAALFYGLVFGMLGDPTLSNLPAELSISDVQRNLNEAALFGTRAPIRWTNGEILSVKDLLLRLMPTVQSALEQNEIVGAADIATDLTERISSGNSPAERMKLDFLDNLSGWRGNHWHAAEVTTSNLLAEQAKQVR